MNVLGVDTDAFAGQTAQAESGGRNLGYHNRARGTAYGLYGITDPTWAGLAKNYPELGLTPENRSDPAAQKRAKDALTQETARGLQGQGLPVNPQTLGMVAFLGPTAGAAVLKASPGASAYDTIQASLGKPWADRYAASNPEVLKPGTTVGDLHNYAAKSYGGGAPTAPTTTASPTGSSTNPLVNPPPADAWVPPPPSGQGPSMTNPLMDPSLLLAGLAPTHRAVQVDYDPWALVPHLA